MEFPNLVMGSYWGGSIFLDPLEGLATGTPLNCLPSDSARALQGLTSQAASGKDEIGLAKGLGFRV